MALSFVSAAGGEPVQVTALDSSRRQISHRQPEFLPDGRHFLYAARDRAENSSIFIGDLQAKPDPKSAQLLMGGVVRASYAPPGYLLFPRDHNLMAQTFDARRLELTGEPLVIANQVDADLIFNTVDSSVSSSGVLAWRSQAGAARQLAWFDRNGKQIPGLDTREPYSSPKLSPDGDRIAVHRLDVAQTGMSTWLLDLVRSGTASRLTFGIGSKWMPVWSPDGRRLVFSFDQPPQDYGLYWKDANGAANEELLLKTSDLAAPTDWSRDGRFILFDQQQGSKPETCVLPLFGDRKPRPLETEFASCCGAFSPDGHWIAYASDESGRFEVYVRSFIEDGAAVTAGKWPVSTAGGYWPRWRHDGKELFFVSADGKIMAVAVKAGPTFVPGSPVALFDTHDHDPSNFGYDVRHDGQRFLISRTLEGGPPVPVNICLNWLAGMKK